MGICFGLILANFIAQIPYFFHLYAQTQSLASDLRSAAIMGGVFIVFVSGSILLARHKTAGFWMMVVFLSAEFLFYARNTLSSVFHGYPLFFQIHNPDIVLRIVYTIGYINLFASGYFLVILWLHRKEFGPAARYEAPRDSGF